MEYILEEFTKPSLEESQKNVREDVLENSLMECVQEKIQSNPGVIPRGGASRLITR